MKIVPRNVGEALLLRLKMLGVEYFFANPGTEFVSILRGFADLPKDSLPEPVMAPHEFQGMSMAYGSYLSTGRPAAVMTHANVGAANALIGLMAASRMNIPLIYIAGETSPSEREDSGSRDKIIHWAQSSKDQASIYREYVKWEAEVKSESSLYDLLDRAHAIAMSEPKGPVAITISRDLLVSEKISAPPAHPQVHAAEMGAPGEKGLADFFSLLSRAERPLLVTNRLGSDPDAVGFLTVCADRHGLSVVTPEDFYVSFPFKHPQHLGFKQGAALKEADLVIVLDCDTPWFPLSEGPSSEAKVVHIGPDPLAESIPLRSHRGDLFLRSSAPAFLKALAEFSPEKNLLARKSWCEKMRAPPREHAVPESALTAGIVSSVLGEFLSKDTVLVNELGLVPDLLGGPLPGTYFRSGNSSPLGWGVGCALGLGLSGQKTAIAAVGDGVFFLSPTLGALFTAAERKIPFLLLVLNNRGLRSVAAAARDFYPDLRRDLPLTTFPAEIAQFEKCAEFVGGYGAKAATKVELRGKLKEAFAFTQQTKKPAVLEAILSPNDRSLCEL